MRGASHVEGNLYQFGPPNDFQKAAAWFFEEGVLVEERGDHDTALELYRKALDYKPTFAPAWVNIGTIFCKRRDWRSAEKAYRSAILNAPNYALAHFDLGNVLDELLLRKEAIKHYLEAVRISPAYADPHYNLAIGHLQLGDYRAAVEHYKLYLQLDKTDCFWTRIAHLQIRTLESSLRPRLLPTGRSQAS